MVLIAYLIADYVRRLLYSAPEGSGLVVQQNLKPLMLRRLS